jgi:hypothetical protein
MDVTMVKKTKKLAHWGMVANRLPHFRFYGQHLYRLSIIVGAIHVGDSTLRESPLPYPVSLNPTYATGGMILVIFRAKKLEYWNDGIHAPLE